MRAHQSISVSVGLLLLAVGHALAADDPAAVEFFEKKIRPVLVESCYECHSAKSPKIRAKLVVDSREGLLRGGETGPSLVAGEPEKSLIMKALRYMDDLEMPPEGKLPDPVIADFQAWIRMGAPFPGAATKAAGPADDHLDIARMKQFWSFRPVGQVAPPAVRQTPRAGNEIDRFILAKLEEKNLAPAPPADKRTLIRRATLDLTGLPPTPREVEAFVGDASLDAFAKVIDGLLASPRYGERWGRYWLDVARYADSKGYVFQEERRYPYSYTYRDWVIRAFNEDLPYDQFLIQQLAADQLQLGEDKRPLAAMGFLTLGRRFLNNPHDIIDDRIDVVTRGMLGLTVSCARCHDHKYDPIPAKDYYSLYGVFASSKEPAELPLLGVHDDPAAAEAFAKEHGKLTAEIEKYRQMRHAELSKSLRTPEQIKLYVEAAREAKDVTPEALRELAKKKDLRPWMLERWRTFLKARNVPQTQAIASADDPLLAEGDSPLAFGVAEVEQLFNRDDRNKLQERQQKIDALVATHAGAPPRAMSMVDSSTPRNARIFIRGNPNNPGPETPRTYLSILSTDEPKPFAKGSGRLELAQAIAHHDNPLTARVMVNRIWMWHFGAGLVRTPSDFGTRGEPPTHPELLDYLARRFAYGGWSIKRIHRLIMLSSTYQQSSMADAGAIQADPDNRLLSRMNRRRLDFEAMRDSLLSVCGELDLKMGGRAVEIANPPFVKRRSVYGFIDRQNLPGMFRTFDFASPDTHSAQRFTTTVPQQALFMLNSPFVIEQAKGLARQVDKPDAQTAQRIQQLYQLLYARPATAQEVELGRAFVEAERVAVSERKAAPKSPWAYGYGEYDPAAQALRSFKTLPHFTGSAWQGGKALPDPKIGWCVLNAAGGHPGNDPAHAVVRRWTAPRDGSISISGRLSHPEQKGDGVRGRIVSSRLKELARWNVHQMSAETRLGSVAVKAGDTIDFIVDCRSTPDFDGFEWRIALRADQEEWDAVAGFAVPSVPTVPAMSPWEKYAQVLLLSNEFVFVD